MKKIFLYFCAFALILQSCENSELEDQSDIDQAKIESLKTMSPENQRVAFNLLNHNERSKFWNDRIDHILKSEKLNSEQKQSINKLKKLVKPQLFDSNNDMFIEDLKGWVMENEVNFEKETFAIYFNSMSDIDTSMKRAVLTHEDDPGGGGGYSDCQCSTESDYCWLSYTYGMTCQSTSCNWDGSGCGTLGVYACNGKCSQ